MSLKDSIENQHGFSAVDLIQAYHAFNGTYVEDGLDVSLDSGRTLQVDAGTVVQDGEEYEISATTVDVPSAGSEPRKDLVIVDDDQEVVVVQGGEEEKQPSDAERFKTAKPFPSDLQTFDDPVVLAEVFVEDGATEIESDELRDRRLTLGLETGAGGQTEEVDNGESGTEATIDWTEGRLHKITLTDDATLDFVDPDFVGRYDIRISQGDGGEHDLDLPDNVIFPDTEPEWTQGEEGDEIVVTFRHDDDGKYIASDTGFYEGDS